MRLDRRCGNRWTPGLRKVKESTRARQGASKGRLSEFQNIVNYLPLLLLAASFVLLGCGERAPNYFPAEVGQKWDMIADGTGDITHFEIVSAPTSDRADAINIHITKTQTRAYWQNYTPGAELWWGMHQMPDKRWVADYTIANFTPPNLMRFDYQHFDNNSYMVI